MKRYYTKLYKMKFIAFENIEILSDSIIENKLLNKKQISLLAENKKDFKQKKNRGNTFLLEVLNQKI